MYNDKVDFFRVQLNYIAPRPSVWSCVVCNCFRPLLISFTVTLPLFANSWLIRILNITRFVLLNLGYDWRFCPTHLISMKIFHLTCKTTVMNIQLLQNLFAKRGFLPFYECVSHVARAQFYLKCVFRYNCIENRDMFICNISQRHHHQPN